MMLVTTKLIGLPVTALHQPLCVHTVRRPMTFDKRAELAPPRIPAPKDRGSLGDHRLAPAIWPHSCELKHCFKTCLWNPFCATWEKNLSFSFLVTTHFSAKLLTWRLRETCEVLASLTSRLQTKGSGWWKNHLVNALGLVFTNFWLFK